MGIKFGRWLKKLSAKPVTIRRPSDFKGHKRAYASYLLRYHFGRWLRFSLIGALTTCLGFLILYLTVTGGGLRPIFGYLIENAITLQIGFLLNRYLTFGDRGAPWLKSLLKWHGVHAGTLGLGQGLFFLLVNIVGLQYMLASLTIALALGILTYALSNLFAFSSKMPSTAA